MVAAVRITNSVVEMLTSAFANGEWSEWHACRECCHTEPDLDLARNGRGYRQQIADEQER